MPRSAYSFAAMRSCSASRAGPGRRCRPCAPTSRGRTGTCRGTGRRRNGGRVAAGLALGDAGERRARRFARAGRAAGRGRGVADGLRRPAAAGGQAERGERCGAGHAVHGEALAALEAAHRRPGLRAVDAVGGDAEGTLDRGHGRAGRAGARAAAAARGRRVLRHGAGGGERHRRDGQRHPGAAAEHAAPTAHLGAAAVPRCPQRSAPGQGRTEISLDSHRGIPPSSRRLRG